jgi:putative membrane protein
MDCWGHGMGGWGYPLMTVTTLLFLGLVIVGIVALVRYLARADRQPVHPPAGPAADQRLAERFARGEIDEHEYRRRLDVLREQSPPPARR